MTPLPNPGRRRRASGTKRWLASALLFLGTGCAAVRHTGKQDTVPDGSHDDAGNAAHAAAPPAKVLALSPVPLWKDGKTVGELDLAQPRAAHEVVVDLG